MVGVVVIGDAVLLVEEVVQFGVIGLEDGVVVGYVVVGGYIIIVLPLVVPIGGPYVILLLGDNGTVVTNDMHEVIVGLRFSRVLTAPVGRVYILHLGGQLALLTIDELGRQEHLGQHLDPLVLLVQDLFGLDGQLVQHQLGTAVHLVAVQSQGGLYEVDHQGPLLLVHRV